MCNYISQDARLLDARAPVKLMPVQTEKGSNNLTPITCTFKILSTLKANEHTRIQLGHAFPVHPFDGSMTVKVIIKPRDQKALTMTAEKQLGMKIRT